MQVPPSTICPARHFGHVSPIVSDCVNDPLFAQLGQQTSSKASSKNPGFACSVRTGTEIPVDRPSPCSASSFKTSPSFAPQHDWPPPRTKCAAHPRQIINWPPSWCDHPDEKSKSQRSQWY